MSKSKNPKVSGKNKKSLVRSSAAEYLTFVAAGGGSEASVEMRYEDENIWLTQKMMATLYDVSVPAINQHLKRIFADNELTREATVKQYLIVQTEGSREVRREVEHYNLQAIIAVGFKIENERAVQFRKWANQIVKDYTIQGWTMDVERLKRGAGGPQIQRHIAARARRLAIKMRAAIAAPFAKEVRPCPAWAINALELPLAPAPHAVFPQNRVDGFLAGHRCAPRCAPRADGSG